MELIQRKPRRHHVSQDDVEAFETAILSDHRVRPAKMNRLAESALWSLHRGLDRTVGDGPLAFISRLWTKPTGGRSRDYFAVLMGLNVAKCAPYFILPGRRSVYLFDAWPDVHSKILRFVRDWNVDHIFVSSKQSAQQLNARMSSDKCVWIPEGVDPQLYLFREYANKDIDVLELGRKLDVYHQKITPALEQAGKRHLFEKVAGQIIFPTRQSFIDGMSRTRISICFPSNVTHPARSGDMETMTMRYLQSMISKCLVVGHAPAEMIDLFGYNPVIEADLENAATQLLDVLNNFDSYKSLIEKNYTSVVQNHTWRKRWETMADILLRHSAM